MLIYSCFDSFDANKHCLEIFIFQLFLIHIQRRNLVLYFVVFIFSKLDKFSYTILKQIVDCFGFSIRKDIKYTSNYICFLLLLNLVFIFISGLDTMARNSDKCIENNDGNTHTCFFSGCKRKPSILLPASFSVVFPPS